MTLFASFYGNTSLADTWDSVDDPGDAGVALFDTLVGFLALGWASGFPLWVHFILDAVFYVALLLLVAGNTALTIAVLIGAIVAAVEALIPG